MKLKSTLVLRVLLLVFAILYAITIIEPIINPNDQAGGEPSVWEVITVIGCFIIYLGGVVLSWINLKWSGIILMAYHFLVWLFALTLWQQAGMVLFLVFPVLVMAALLLRNWSVIQDEIVNRDLIATQYTLDILIINYALIYFLVVAIQLLSNFSNIHFATSDNNLMNYQSLTGAVLLFDLLLFIIALITLRKNRITSGLLIISWYAIIVIISLTNYDFFNTGPWMFIALPVLINGIFYVKDGIRLSNMAK